MFLEFGECLHWKSPRLAGYNVLLEARWHDGVWLGRHWAGPTHYVFDPATKAVVEVRAAQRKPASERWRLEAVQSVCAWPKGQEQQADGEVRIIPGSAPPVDAAPPAFPRLPTRGRTVLND